MAKITINVDTESESLEVMIDGKKVENVNCVSIYTRPEWYDPTDMELSVNIDTYMEDKDSGVKTITRLMAKDNAEAKKMARAGAKTSKAFSDFVEVNKDNQFQVDVQDFFNLGGK